LDAFDEAVLSVCGGWGRRVDKQVFINLLQDTRHDKVGETIYRGVDGTVRTQQSRSRFVAELANIWFSENGFAHVFCGEPSKRDLGGMHFFGRYLQAQQQGWAGYISVTGDQRAREKCRKDKESIDSPIFATAIQYTVNNARNIKCLSGYDTEMNAADILIEATRAYKTARAKRSHGKFVCLHHVAGTASYSSHYAVFVTDGDGIRTFYPLTSSGFQQQRKRLDFCG
jgi:hypothetical protein